MGILKQGDHSQQPTNLLTNFFHTDIMKLHRYMISGVKNQSLKIGGPIFGKVNEKHFFLVDVPVTV